MKKYRYLFGPVPSRRFGRSLGIDLLSQKTCCLDCVFCQLGRTETVSTTQQAFVPVEDVIDEIKDWLKTDGEADYITLSGSGEPTLHADFGRVLEFLKETTIPSLLLSNGALFFLPEVREAAACADNVKLSLSAWDQVSFQWVNRPHKALRFNQMMDGQKAFRSMFGGKLWLEVFLLAGINSMPDKVEKIAAHAKTVSPDCIQLNTVVRPPAEAFASAVSKNKLTELARMFVPRAEVIVDASVVYSKHGEMTENKIMAMLRRRPCTSDQIARGSGMHINDVLKYLMHLEKNKHIRAVHRTTDVYYTVFQ